MIEIIPAILARDLAEFATAKEKVDGLSDWIQIDFVDGEFAGNRTVTPEDLASEAFESDREAHLMVNDVPAWLERLKEKGYGRIYTPVETTSDLAQTANRVRQMQAEFGLAIGLDVDIAEIITKLEHVDRALILGIQPGYQGQEFHPEALQRIQAVREKFPELPIAADGGVNAETLPLLVAAGVTSVTVGHDLLSAGEPAAELERLQEISESSHITTEGRDEDQAT